MADEDPAVLIAAARALETLGDPAGIPALEKHANHQHAGDSGVISFRG